MGGGPLGPCRQVECAMHPIWFLVCVHDVEADAEFLELHLVEDYSTPCILFFIDVIILVLDVLFPLL